MDFQERGRVRGRSLSNHLEFARAGDYCRVRRRFREMRRRDIDHAVSGSADQTKSKYPPRIEGERLVHSIGAVSRRLGDDVQLAGNGYGLWGALFHDCRKRERRVCVIRRGLSQHRG